MKKQLMRPTILALSLLCNGLMGLALAYFLSYNPPIAKLISPSGKTYVLSRREVLKTINERHAEEVASDLVGRMLVQLAAEEKHLSLDQEEFESRYNAWLAEPGTRSRLDAGELKESDLKEQLNTLVLLDELTWSELTPKAQKEKLKAAFAADKGRFEEVHLRHIIVEDPNKAQDLVDRLQAGVDFKELAKRFSLDPLTKEEGGDLGWKARSDLSSDLRSLIFSLPVGSVSSPIASEGGYHLFLVEDRKDSFKDCEVLVRRQLASQLRAETIANLRKNFKITRLEGLSLQKMLNR